MAKRKSSEELLQEKINKREALNERIRQLKEEERRLNAKIKQEKDIAKRKGRINLVSMLYKKLGRDFIEGDVERLAAFIDGQEERGFWFSKAMNEGLDLPSPKESNASSPQTPDPDTSVPTE